MASGPAGWLRKGSPPKSEQGREQRGIREERREEREERREKSAERSEKREERRKKREERREKREERIGKRAENIHAKTPSNCRDPLPFRLEFRSTLGGAFDTHRL